MVNPLNPVYEHAEKLKQTGYSVIPVLNHEKVSLTKNWQHAMFSLDSDMTGVNIKTGVVIENTDLYPLVIDIDIFNEAKRDAVYNQIMACLETDKVYIERTASGGIHIITLATCKDDKNRVFKMQERNCNARHGHAVEIFFGGYRQVMVAPSKAVNKKGQIAAYQRVSELDMTDIDQFRVMDFDGYTRLKGFLEALSNDYRSRVYVHEHRISEEDRN